MQTAAVKRLLVGRPRQSRELKHQLLPKWMALPVFSSDPLSSTAYATQEMMIVLALAGAAAYRNVLPLAVGVALLLAIVVVSYRQTVRAYPHGGGAYIVSRENLGDVPGLTAASALLIDYTLTVSVSIAAGVAAITSALPALAEYRVGLALGFVALVTLANLRGVKEAGVLFAIPTYLFVATMFALIGSGLVQCIGGCPQAPSAGTPVEAEAGLSLFLLLRAFSSGATALTGVEAISNGVPAFRFPQSRNAAATLGVMGVIAVSMFLGISVLAVGTGVVATEESTLTRTVNADIAQAVFGSGIGFFLVQFVTAAILVLAANTAYADFPRLASVLAVDRFLPRQFVSRGDRLVFSNGILVLAAAASLLLVVFGADVTRLIQLYVVGVFTSFTLSQIGMVRHHLRLREPDWRRGALINGVGAATTGVVLVVVAVTKFTGGAWIVIVMIPALVVAMQRVHNHYGRVSAQLRAGVLDEEEPQRHHVVVVVDQVDEAAARAVSYARGVNAASVRALALARAAEIRPAWEQLAPEVPLDVVEPGSGALDRLRQQLTERAAAHPGDWTTALVAETLSSGWADQLAHHRTALRLKSALLGEGALVVTDLTAPIAGPGPYTIEEPVEHHVVVLVSAVHRATLRALAFAEALEATSVRALSVNVDTERSMRMLEAWEDWGVTVPLEVVDSPFRSIVDAVRDYVREFLADGRRGVVTCVLPEFVLPHWYQQPLHNQTALLIKGALLFERGVVTTSVPYHIDDLEGDEDLTPAVEAGSSA